MNHQSQSNDPNKCVPSKSPKAVIRQWRLRQLSLKRFHHVGHILGVRPEASAEFGLARGRSKRPKSATRKLIRQRGEYHATLIAGTGQGKGVSVLIPAGLMHDGQYICVDPKGEITQSVSRRRLEMGDRVVVINPFDTVDVPSDCINPLDLLQLKGLDATAIEDVCETLAAELGAGHEIQRDPFWWNTATSLLAGLIAHAASHADPAKRNLNTVVAMLSQDDVVYALAVVLDTEGKKMNPFAYKRISEFLATPDSSSGATRSSILVSALQMIHCLQAQRVARVLSSTSFDLNDLLDGEAPLSVMIVFPPEKARSHRGLLRLIVSTLVQVLWARKQIPTRRTLFCLDEAANIGKLDFLPTMHSYGRGCGVSMLSAWQSLGQLADVYQTDWRVIVENSLIQMFGLHTTAVEPVANFLGVPSEMLRRLTPTQQVVALPSGMPMVLEKIDYRTHPMLSLMADPNPRYGKGKQENEREPLTQV